MSTESNEDVIIIEKIIDRIDKIEDRLLELESKQGKKKPVKSDTSDIWKVYADCYKNKYGVIPPHSAKLFSQCKMLVSTIGFKEAIELVYFYFTQTDQFYSKQYHPIGLLLRDCQMFYTRMMCSKKPEEPKKTIQQDVIEKDGHVWVVRK